MINEKVLSEAIREYFKNLIEQGLQEVEILKCNAELQKLIEEQLRVGEWIPCGDELPPNYQRVLTCDERGNEHIMFHHEGFKYPFGVSPKHTTKYMPVAWMPLPEPYGGSNNDR